MTDYTEINQFNPDWVPAPGETISEILEGFGWTQVTLAQRMGRTTKFINQLIKGKAPLDENTALRLEKVLGVRASFWLSLENEYQLSVARKKEEEKLAEQEEWASSFPVSAMINLNWITKRETKGETVKELLEFFAVVSPDSWREVWGGTLSVSYRGSNTFTPKTTSVAAWLRYGQRCAAQTTLPVFDKAAFGMATGALRALAIQGNPDIFIPRLKEICAACGVLVLFVPELPQTTLSGAAHWYHGKPIIQLSLRHKTNDHLWFSFFHEMKHILSHSAKEIYVNERDSSSEEEMEADLFARNTLIPPGKHKELLSQRITLQLIKDFAFSIGIAPGIVVGRLQHEKLLPQSYGNGLKVRYKWKLSPRQ